MNNVVALVLIDLQLVAITVTMQNLITLCNLLLTRLLLGLNPKKSFGYV